MSLEKSIEYYEKMKSSKNPLKKGYYYLRSRIELSSLLLEPYINLEFANLNMLYMKYVMYGELDIDELRNHTATLGYLIKRFGDEVDPIAALDYSKQRLDIAFNFLYESSIKITKIANGIDNSNKELKKVISEISSNNDVSSEV